MSKNTSYAPKYISALSKDSADIFLFDEIGGDKINGQDFAEEIHMLNRMGVSEINVHISSPGGDVLEGLAIFHAILNSEVHVNTMIEGVAASMAGVIAMAGDTITMTDASRLMIHNPFSPGGDDNDEKLQNALSALRETLLTVFENRSDLTPSKLSKIMDEETWLSPKEALDGGFVDKIVKTKSVKKQSAVAIMNIINQNKVSKTNTTNMEALAKHFGLSKDASEDAILEEAVKVQSSLDEANSELETIKSELKVSNDLVDELKAKVQGFETEAEELTNKLVEETIDQAITEGKVEEEGKEALLNTFKGNLDGIKAVVNNIKVSTKAPSITNNLSDGGNSGDANIPEKYQGLSLRDLEKKDAEFVINLMENHKDTYANLYKAEYGKELN